MTTDQHGYADGALQGPDRGSDASNARRLGRYTPSRGSLSPLQNTQGGPERRWDSHAGTTSGALANGSESVSGVEPIGGRSGPGAGAWQALNSAGSRLAMSPAAWSADAQFTVARMPGGVSLALERGGAVAVASRVLRRDEQRADEHQPHPEVSPRTATGSVMRYDVRSQYAYHRMSKIMKLISDGGVSSLDAEAKGTFAQVLAGVRSPCQSRGIEIGRR